MTKTLFFLLNLLLIAAVCYGDYSLLSGGSITKAQCSQGFVLIGLCNLLYAFLKGHKPIAFPLVMTVGLIAAMLGDIRIDRNFIEGAALFALGHVLFYIAQCFLHRPKALDFALGGLLFVGAAIFLLVQPSLHFPDPSLRWLCLAYALIISLMTGKALAAAIQFPSLQTVLLAIGTVLFFFSDVMLVVAWFIGWQPAGLLCMSTYYPAECLLSFSLFWGKASLKSLQKCAKNGA